MENLNLLFSTDSPVSAISSTKNIDIHSHWTSKYRQSDEKFVPFRMIGLFLTTASRCNENEKDEEEINSRKEEGLNEG